MKLDSIQGVPLVEKKGLRDDIVTLSLTSPSGLDRLAPFKGRDKLNILREMFNYTDLNYEIKKISAASNVYSRIQEQHKVDLFILDSLSGKGLDDAS